MLLHPLGAGKNRRDAFLLGSTTKFYFYFVYIFWFGNVRGKYLCTVVVSFVRYKYSSILTVDGTWDYF